MGSEGSAGLSKEPISLYNCAAVCTIGRQALPHVRWI